LDRDERVLPNCSADLDYDAESLRASAMVSVAEFSLLSSRLRKNSLKHVTVDMF
jgi:hypothetical protein